MTEGVFALVGVALGAVLGFVGTAVTERWRHSYIRNDARTDRYAATLHEVLDAYMQFVLAWSPVVSQAAQTGSVDILDPAIMAGPPGIAYRSLVAVTERVHVDSIRQRLVLFVEGFMTSVVNGTIPDSIDAAGNFGTALATDIGAELRKLEAQ